MDTKEALDATMATEEYSRRMAWMTDNRARDIGVIVGVLALLVGLGAWLFPRGTSSQNPQTEQLATVESGTTSSVPAETTPPTQAAASGSPSTEAPQAEEVAQTEPEALSLPVYEGEVGHLLGGVATDLYYHLEEDEIYKLDLIAYEENVIDSGSCNGFLGECSILWAVECEPGVSLTGPTADDLDYIVQNCGAVLSLRTVDENFDDVTGWTWLRGAYGLSGYFAVAGGGFGQGITAISIREIPPEIAKQLE